MHYKKPLLPRLNNPPLKGCREMRELVWLPSFTIKCPSADKIPSKFKKPLVSHCPLHLPILFNFSPVAEFYIFLSTQGLLQAHDIASYFRLRYFNIIRYCSFILRWSAIASASFAHGTWGKNIYTFITLLSQFPTHGKIKS